MTALMLSILIDRWSGLSQPISSSPRTLQPALWLRTKYLVFTILGPILAFLLQHNERFVVAPKDPAWERCQPCK
jgi:hypothetical protein